MTGGAGFIGSHIVDALLAAGNRVRVLDNLATGRKENLAHVADQIEFLEGDVRDASAVRRAVSGVDCVFHEAALASVPRSISDPLATHDACVTGTLIVLDEARKAGVRRVVYAASSSAYGNSQWGSKREVDMPSPLSPYAAAKLAGELYCRAFCESYGLETVALRYFNVFGPRQSPEGAYAAVIPRFISDLCAGVQPTIFGDGGQTRDFTYIDNVVQANLLAAQKPGVAGRTFNVGAGERTALIDVYRILQSALATSLEPIFAPPRLGDVRDSLADVSQIRQALGYEPTVSLAEGLRRTVQWYRSST